MGYSIIEVLDNGVLFVTNRVKGFGYGFLHQQHPEALFRNLRGIYSLGRQQFSGTYRYEGDFLR